MKISPQSSEQIQQLLIRNLSHALHTAILLRGGEGGLNRESL